MLSPPSPETLKRLYWNEKLSCNDIEGLLDIRHAHYYLKKYNIPRRTISQGLLLCYKKRPNLDATTIKKLYLDDFLSIDEIASKYKTSWKNISKLLDENHISKRTGGPHNKKNPRWKGGRSLIGGQYIGILLPEHPLANKDGYVPEHRLIWERENQKVLPKGWVVHHLNGDKLDNRPVNLAGMPRDQHKRIIGAYQKRTKELEDEVIELIKTIEYHQNQRRFFVYQNN